MKPQTDRRRFLGRTAALFAAGASLSAPTGRVEAADEVALRGADAMIPIVDTHQHLWDLKKFRLPWLIDAPLLARSYLMEDYLEATRGLGVVKSVYMEVDVEPTQQVEEAEYVIDLCQRRVGPMVGAVISGRPDSEGFREYISRFERRPEIKGVRQVLHRPITPPGYCLEEPFLRGVRLLGERGLSFDLCMRPEELGDAAKLIDACPGTSFILDHCGNAKVREKDRSAWRADLSKVAGRKDVVGKVSGIVASADPGPWTPDDLAPIVNHVLDAFGPDRVVFGGDWPVCTLAASYREWVEALRTIVRERSEEERRKLFHENAVRVYRLA